MRPLRTAFAVNISLEIIASPEGLDSHLFLDSVVLPGKQHYLLVYDSDLHLHASASEHYAKRQTPSFPMFLLAS